MSHGVVVAVGATPADVERLAAEVGAHLPGPQVDEVLKALMVRSPVVLPDDARPEAGQLGERRLEDVELAAWVTRWVGAELARGPVLLADPRALWFHAVWRAAARAHGADLRFVTVLRHPVELAAADADAPRHRDVGVVAGWCNLHLAGELVSRGDARTFVPAPSSSETAPRAVDVPEALAAVGDALWVRLVRLVEQADDAVVLAELDAVRADYARLHDEAVALAHTHTRSREVAVRRTARANAGREFRERIDELEAQLAEANDGATTDRHRFPR